MKKTFFWLLFVFWLPVLATQAMDDVYVQYLDNRNGLPNNTVRTIFQDSKGFIWMSTLNGISCYDGYSFTNYFPQAGKGISLADRRVKSIREDVHGFLWFTTSADMVSCFDLHKNCFVDFTGCGEYKQNYGYYEVYPEAVWLWGKHNGLRMVTYRDGQFHSRTFTAENRQLKTNVITFLKKDKTGQIWIGTTKGLYKYAQGRLSCVNSSASFSTIQLLSGRKIAFITYKGELLLFDGRQMKLVAHLTPLVQGEKISGGFVMQDKWMIFTTKGAYNIDLRTFQCQPATSSLNIAGAQTFQDSKGYFWVYNRSGKLLLVSPRTGEIKSLAGTSPLQAKFMNNERYKIAYDKNGIAWLVSNISGLYSYNHQTGEFRHYDESDGRFPLVTSNAVQSILIDRSGGFWLGSENTGVSHFRFVNNRASYFYVEKENPLLPGANSIRLAERMPDGSIFLGTRDGDLYKYDSSFHLSGKESFNTNIYAVSQDKHGILWKASRGDGLFIGNKQYKHNDKDPRSLAFNQLFCLLKDRKDRMWVGTLGRGLDLAVPDGKGGYTFRHFLDKTYAQSNVRTLLQDKNGWLWVGTSDGIYLFEPDSFLKNGHYYHYLPYSDIKQIKEDSKGNIYFSESGVGFGISRMGRDYSQLSIEHYGIESGLPNTMVQAFVEDAKGRMWLSTENGVSCFNLKQKTFDNYFFSSDLKRNVYNESAAFRLPDGRLAFGTNYGLQLIDPKQLKGAPQASPVVFTGLKLNGIEESPLKKALAYSSSIDLDYDQNSFVINFSTLDYPISMLPQYSYLLENYDKTWSTPSTLNFAGYKNLSPGTYKLRVKVRNAGGTWSRESSVEITIAPPFWRTPWAYIFYLLLIAVAGYTAFRIVKNMNALRNKVRLEKQLTDYKLVFFTNISHEFRTPLTLIQAALDRLHRTRLSPETNASVRMMAKSTSRMMRLVNQLMDFRKMEKGKLKPALEKADVIAFIRDICKSFNDRAMVKKMKFNYMPGQDTFEMYIDKEKLDKIIYNLLSNAFKYTPSGGSISCSAHIDTEGKMLVIQVKDTGVGIPKNKQKELFGRFMQSSFSSNSMGIGLHLTNELVHTLKGTLSYQDNPAGGAVFTVKLPTDESIYEKKDFLSSESVLLQEEDKQRQDIAELEAEPENTLSGNGRPLPEPPMNKRNLLVIEDDDDVRSLLKDELSTYFEVATAADGEAGIAYAIENDVDLIVCDVMMPGLSGFDVTQKLKTNFATSHIPIILLTALGDADNYLQGIESGADAYVTKPFSINLLLARISHLIEQRDKLREKFSKDPTSVRPIICTTDEDKKFTDKLLKVIEEHLQDGEFTADDFASEMALGRTVFYKKVKGVTGYSPKEYIRIMRMKKAAKLLLEPNVTVAEVAYDVGMNDPFYFSRCFKSQFGISPSFYQKSGGVIPEK